MVTRNTQFLVILVRQTQFLPDLVSLVTMQSSLFLVDLMHSVITQ